MAKIVIAEDNSLFRKALKIILSDFDIIGVACDGQQALNIIDRTKPDLLILDLAMPKMNGFELLKKARKRYPDLKVLALTIHASRQFFQEAVKEGINGYCLKDEGREKVLEAIDCVLDGRTYYSSGIQQDEITPTDFNPPR